jgi:hypothetical protein
MKRFCDNSEAPLCSGIEASTQNEEDRTFDPSEEIWVNSLEASQN